MIATYLLPWYRKLSAFRLWRQRIPYSGTLPQSLDQVTCRTASLGWGCRKDRVLPQVQTGGAALPPESSEPAEPTVVETSVVGRDAVWSVQKPQWRVTTQVHAARPRHGREELDSFKRQLLIDSWALGETGCLARGSQADQRLSMSLGQSDPLSGPSSSSPRNGKGQKPAGEEGISKLCGQAAQTPRQPLCPSLGSSPRPSWESSLISWPPRFKHGLAQRVMQARNRWQLRQPLLKVEFQGLWLLTSGPENSPAYGS